MMNMKRTLTIALLLTAGFSQSADPKPQAKLPDIKTPDLAGLQTFDVVRVVDGDTISIRGQRDEVKVRLIGVDTPETVHPSKPVQHYGKEASCFTTNLLKGEQVYLRYEGEKPTTDKYGRLLAYVYRVPDGLFVNAEIIRQGYGHAYVQYPFKHLEVFRQLEQFARQAGKGLWASAAKSAESQPPAAVSPKPVAPDATVYRTRTGSKYHGESCSYLRSSKIPISLRDAKSRGLGPCSRCGPPR